MIGERILGLPRDPEPEGDRPVGPGTVRPLSPAGTRTHGLGPDRSVQPTRRWTPQPIGRRSPDGIVRAGRFDLTDRVVLVTGGSRGLGRAMALGFADAGADVVVASRKLDACREVAARDRGTGAPGPGRGRSTSATGMSSTDWWTQAYDRFGRIDVLVNNAGMSLLYGDLADVGEAMWDKVVGLNLKGPFRLTALVAPRMVADGGGSVINVSSTGSIRPAPFMLPYDAAKAGLNALTVGFAHAYGPTVRVNCIMAGPVLHRRDQGVGPRGLRRRGAPPPRPRPGRPARRGRGRRPLLRLRRLELHDRRRAAGRRRDPLSRRRRELRPAVTRPGRLSAILLDLDGVAGRVGEPDLHDRRPGHRGRRGCRRASSSAMAASRSSTAKQTWGPVGRITSCPASASTRWSCTSPAANQCPSDPGNGRSVLVWELQQAGVEVDAVRRAALDVEAVVQRPGDVHRRPPVGDHRIVMFRGSTGLAGVAGLVDGEAQLQRLHGLVGAHLGAARRPPGCR